MCARAGRARAVAGGLLSGKHAPTSDAAGTRFDPSNTMYRDRYWKPTFFAALDAVKVSRHRISVACPHR